MVKARVEIRQALRPMAYKIACRPQNLAVTELGPTDIEVTAIGGNKWLLSITIILLRNGHTLHGT